MVDKAYSQDELDNKEKYYINKLKAHYSYGNYNISSGGAGFVPIKCDIKYHQDRLKGKKRGHRKYTEEERDRLRRQASEANSRRVAMMDNDGWLLKIFRRTEDASQYLDVGYNTLRAGINKGGAYIYNNVIIYRVDNESIVGFATTQNNFYYEAYDKNNKQYTGVQTLKETVKFTKYKGISKISTSTKDGVYEDKDYVVRKIYVTHDGKRQLDNFEVNKSINEFYKSIYKEKYTYTERELRKLNMSDLLDGFDWSDKKGVGITIYLLKNGETDPDLIYISHKNLNNREQKYMNDFSWELENENGDKIISIFCGDDMKFIEPYQFKLALEKSKIHHSRMSDVHTITSDKESRVI